MEQCTSIYEFGLNLGVLNLTLVRGDGQPYVLVGFGLRAPTKNMLTARRPWYDDSHPIVMDTVEAR